MYGEFQDQGQLDQDLEDWVSPRGSQSVHGFFSEEEKQESIRMEDSAPEGSRMRNQGPEGETTAMAVVKWSDKVEGSGDNVYSPLCGGLYKEEKDSLVPWSGADPDSKMNCFTWSKVNNDCILSEDQYDEEFKKWKGHIHNGQFLSQSFKEKQKTEEKFSEYAVSAKLNGIPR